MKFSTGALHEILSMKSEFRENRLSGGHTLLTGAREFLTSKFNTRPMFWVKPGIENIHVTPLRMFRENT
jgi:hypothetical protein